MSDSYYPTLTIPGNPFSSVKLDTTGLNLSSPDLFSSPILKPPLTMSDPVAALQSIANGITGAATTYYDTQGRILAAKANAQSQSQGSPLTRVSNAFPPVNLLLFGGFALAALALLSGGGSARRR